MRFPIIAAFAFLTASASHSEPLPLKTRCTMLAKPVFGLAQGADTLSKGVREFGFTEIAAQLEGPAAEAARKAEAARLRLGPEMRAYIAAVEDLTYQLRVCGR